MSIFQRGRDYSKESQRNPNRGSMPKESSRKGINSRERTTLFH